jgi:hypothetical protein
MARRVDMDWVTVKYKDIFSILAVLVGIIVIAAAVFFYWRYQGNPQGQAERAISKAQRMADSMDTPEAAPDVKSTVGQARTMIGQARTEYSQAHYAKALSIAKDVLETLKGAQTASPKSQKFAVLVSSEGSVEVKRTSQHLFSSAKEKMILEDGDIVKTGQNSWAKIKYHNNQTQIISPDSLVVIQALSTGIDGGNRIEVALKKGRVETQTPETMTAKDESIIATDTTKIRPSASSRVGVAQEASGEVVTSVFAGSTEVEAAGHSENLDAGDSGVTIVTSAAGISSPEPLIAPPAAEFPRDQQILRVDDPVKYPISFEWKGGTGNTALFQLSAKPLFSSLLAPEQTVTGGKFSVDGLPAGTYYWRLRSPGDPSRSYWSPIYRFRILQVFQRPKVKRDLKLEVDSTPIGDGVILQGKTDPGVSVSINDLEIPVNADGTFSKIVIFSDVGTQSVQVRAFDDEGNEKIWRKSFQSSSY